MSDTHGAEVQPAGDGLLSEEQERELAALERRQATGGLEEQPRSFGIMLVVLGALGLAAAFTLAIDKYRILEDPSFVPSCNLNPVLSCGSVMKTDQAQAFGFPNPLIGLIAFGVVITLGVLIAARVHLPRWVMGGLALGAVLGATFVHWLAFQSMYRIGALCPWCMVVWVVTLAITLWSLIQAAATVPSLQSAARAVFSVRYVVLVAWYLVFVVAALVEFWDYWKTLL